MLKVWINKIVIALVAMSAICVSSVYAARSYSSDVLVVPSRFTIIQLAFDIVALRDVNLVAYESSSDGADPLLYVWNKTSSAWKNLTIDEYAIGSFSATTPREMILVGSDADLPASLISGASQAKRVIRIDSLNVVPVINTLNKSMKFSQQEWQVLAKRHGLQIKDRNEERRRWGRYGDPNKAKLKKVADDSESPMPPKACDSSLKEGFEALDAEFDVVEDSAELGLPPEDLPIEAFEKPQTDGDDVPVEETPVVIRERSSVVVDEVDESAEDK